MQAWTEISAGSDFLASLKGDGMGQLDHLYRTAPIGLALFDRDLRCLRVNEFLARINGKSAGDHIGLPLEQVLPKLSPQHMSSVREVLRTKEPTIGITVRNELGNGRAHRTFSLSIHPLLDADDDVIAFHCFVQDITEHVRDTAAIHERLAFEQFLADLSARFVHVASEEVDAKVKDGLRRLVEFLGVDRSSLARVTPEGQVIVLSSYAAPGIVQQPMGKLGDELEWYVNEIYSGRVVRFSRVDELPHAAEMCKRFARGTGMKSHVAIPIDCDASPCALGIATFRQEREFPEEMIPRLRLIGEVFRNALARRDAEVKLHRMQAELAHVTRVSTLGQLAASIAHEINQPLCSIVNNAQAGLRLLASRSPDLEEVAGSLRDIVAGGKRAGDVVARSHGLLKRRDLEFAPLCLNDVIRDVTSLLRSDALIRRVTIDLNLTQRLPRITGDRVQLQQVVLNLLVNAMDATTDVEDGVRKIVVCSDATDSHVRVTVNDTGVGLSAEVARRMFEPFFTTKRSGLGMGLAIIQSIVESHGGRMWATPNPGRGASITFEISRGSEQSS
jgi:PAS domain S-box-containing protein